MTKVTCVNAVMIITSRGVSLSYFSAKMPSNNELMVQTTTRRAAPAESEAYRALAAPSRRALLSALVRAGRPVDAAEAAEAVGLHRNTARVQLETLVSAGLLRRRAEKRDARGRPRVLYEPTRSGSEQVPAGRPPASSASYRELARMLALQLAEFPDVRDAAIRAGRRWAAAIDERPLPAAPLSAGDAMDMITEMLDRLGFDPEADDAGQRILLHRCPFADVARENRAVICGIHLGMLTGTAERLDAPLAVASLDPFAADDPPLCIVRLANRGEGSASAADGGDNGAC
jgi:predicted ArsR family transcriptional regulator